MALLFQNFDFELDDPNYRLQHKQTLTIKPKDFYVRATLRKGITSTSLCRHLQGNKEDLAEADSIIRKNREKGATLGDTSGLAPITILYGSNSGTCESMAQRLAADAPMHGYSVTHLDSSTAAQESYPGTSPPSSSRRATRVSRQTMPGSSSDGWRLGGARTSWRVSGTPSLAAETASGRRPFTAYRNWWMRL